MIRIGIDLMGGDFAPEETLKGILHYLEEQTRTSFQKDTVQIVGFGEPWVQTLPLFASVLRYPVFEFVECGPSIQMAESPVKAIQKRSDSSVVRGIHWLAQGKIDAFVSAGNTGAIFVAGTQFVGKLPGVDRPALVAYLPRLRARTGILIDVGANVECKPEHLVNFARLGTIFCETVLGYQDVRVGLLTVGEEKGKGNSLVRAAFDLLEQAKAEGTLHFIGNVEGRDLFTEKADVIVCDGFTGNVVLKALESFAVMLLAEIEGKLHRHLSLDVFRWEKYGAVPVLGLRKPVLIGHGIARSEAFYQMILMAQKILATRLVERLQARLSALAVTSSSSSSSSPASTSG